MKLAALAMALTAASPACAQTPALWSLSDADTTIYLFGTVHALDEGQQWFSGDVAAAYRQADEVVLETTIADSEAVQASGLKYAASERSLRDLLPKPKIKALEAALRKVGAERSAMDRFDPWLASLIVGTVALRDSGLKSDLSVDKALQEAAARDQKAVVALETPDQQFAAYDDIPLTAQLSQLVATLDAPDRVKRSAVEIVGCWKVGDLACVSAASDRETGLFPEVRDALLVRRNARWAQWIAERMRRPGVVMVAVGIEHFVGAGSLPGALSDAGFSVSRVGVADGQAPRAKGENSPPMEDVRQDPPA